MNKQNYYNRFDVSSDPLNADAIEGARNLIIKIRRSLPVSSLNGMDDYNCFLAKMCKDKEVLDLGICEHSIERINSSSWKHRIIKNHAKSTLGLDIDKSLIKYLDENGFDVVCADATGDSDLNRKFDVIHVGDLIEHVSSPLNLLNFARRHLKKDGRIIVRTPNPFCYNYFYKNLKSGTDISNLEHICYITPFHAIELGRRASLSLNAVYYQGHKKPARRFKILQYFDNIKSFLKFGFFPPEIYTTINVFEYVIKEQK